MTYTYVTLDVSHNTYVEIKEKLEAADYQHAFHDGDASEGVVIDMHGLALVNNGRQRKLSVDGRIVKIGDLRRRLFVNHNCKWNGLVRDITAANESHDEEVNEQNVYIGLLETMKANAVLDHQFPRSGASRIDEMFVASDAE